MKSNTGWAQVKRKLQGTPYSARKVGKGEFEVWDGTRYVCLLVQMEDRGWVATHNLHPHESDAGLKYPSPTYAIFYYEERIKRMCRY